MLDLSIAIISFNTKKLTIDCIRSVLKYSKLIDYEIVVVDNDSEDGSVEAIQRLSRTRVIVNKDNRGFAKANNQAFKIAKGRYFLLLNSDTVVHNNVLGEMVAWLDKHPKVGIASCALKNKDGSQQGTGGYFPTLFKVFAWMFFLEDLPIVSRLIKPFHPMHSQSPFYKGEDFFQKEKQMDWLTGAFLLVRSQIYKDVQGLDENYFMYTEEVDFCYKAKKKGWQVWYLPKWSITHFGGASATAELSLLSEYKGIKIFYSKYMPKWQLLFVRVFLKLGAVARMFIWGLLKGPQAVKIYAKAIVIG